MTITLSNTLASSPPSGEFGTEPVGMMAKWSDTPLSSKTRAWFSSPRSSRRAAASR